MLTRKNEERNESTRETTERDILEVIVRKRRLRWLCHVQHMEDSGRAKEALHWMTNERQIEVVLTYLERYGMDRYGQWSETP